jgi:hypothetical protein
LGGATEGWLGIDPPLDPTKFAEQADEGDRLRKSGEIAEEAESASFEPGAQLVEE